VSLAPQESTSHLKGRLHVPSAKLDFTQAHPLRQVAPACLTAGVANADIVTTTATTTMVADKVAPTDAPALGTPQAGRAMVATVRRLAGRSRPTCASARS
jgi:hypothetical protein